MSRYRKSRAVLPTGIPEGPAQSGLMRRPPLRLPGVRPVSSRLWLHDMDPEWRGSWRVREAGCERMHVIRAFPPLTAPAWTIAARTSCRPYPLYQLIRK